MRGAGGCGLSLSNCLDGGRGGAEGPGAGGQRESDAEGIEAEFDAALEFASGAHLLTGECFEAGAEDHGGGGEVVEAEDFEWFEEEGGEFGVVEKGGGDGLEFGDEEIGIVGAGDGEVEEEAGVAAGDVGEAADGAIGEGVEGAIAGAQDSGPEADVLDGAAPAIDFADIAGADVIFEQEEDAGEGVFDEGAGTEAEGETPDTEAGEDGGEVEAELTGDRESGEEPDGGDGDFASDAGEGIGAFFEFGVGSGPAPAQDPERMAAEARDEANSHPVAQGGGGGERDRAQEGRQRESAEAVRQFHVGSGCQAPAWRAPVSSRTSRMARLSSSRSSEGAPARAKGLEASPK